MLKQPSNSRLILVGPMPPPIHGQSIVMNQLASELSNYFPRMRIADTGGHDSVPWLRPFKKAGGSAAAALWSISGADAVYIAVKAGKGMWFTAAVAGLARLFGARVFLHHHSYLYVRERARRMVALTRIAGPSAYHIVLSKSMETDLHAVMPEINRVLVMNNARWIDKALLRNPIRDEGAEIVLGHLSNLSSDKGTPEVVELAIRLKREGAPARLVLAGPSIDEEAGMHVDRAVRELGDLFEYLGPITGDAKREFFGRISHFVFPSRNEALPLVLYEAMASGAVCLTTRQGAIPEQLSRAPALIAESSDSFVDEALLFLKDKQSSRMASLQSRSAYLSSLTDSDVQLEGFISLLDIGAERSCHSGKEGNTDGLD